MSVIALAGPSKNDWLLKWQKNKIYVNSIIARGTKQMIFFIIILAMNYT